MAHEIEVHTPIALAYAKLDSIAPVVQEQGADTLIDFIPLFAYSRQRRRGPRRRMKCAQNRPALDLSTAGKIVALFVGVAKADDQIDFIDWHVGHTFAFLSCHADTQLRHRLNYMRGNSTRFYACAEYTSARRR